MVSIAEQARQNPKNATPFGFDMAEVVYPGVNTCATVTAVGGRGFAGLHLGLYMSAGEEGGKGSENSKPIDDAYLDMYLHVLKQQAYVKAATMTQRTALNRSVARKSLDRIYVAGALAVWKSSFRNTLWKKLKEYASKLAEESGAQLEYFQFNDDVAFTVDIHVNRAGVRFTKVDSDDQVPRLTTFAA
jgi:hypothetical protein